MLFILGISKMRKVKCGMQSAECTWLATKKNHVTLPIPQFTTSRLAMHSNKMRKVILESQLEYPLNTEEERKKKFFLVLLQVLSGFMFRITALHLAMQRDFCT